jgi:hypothetical protein
MDLFEQHQKFFAARRWYQNDEARCEQRVVYGRQVHRCEGVLSHDGEHAYVATRRLAGASDFELQVVSSADVLM